MIKLGKIGLRSVEMEDLKLLRDWRNNTDFRRNFREFKELNMINQKNWYDRVNLSTNDFMFIIERLSDQMPLGACGLLYTNWIIRSADFSFYIGFDDLYIDEDGYAFDAAKALIDYGFNNLNLNKIWMELYEFDAKKINFFTSKFNFKQDGVLRQNCYEYGKFYNSVIISLLKQDYIDFIRFNNEV